ncbi:Com family DNA-binding transcriptional regulator [Chromobacterium haemolyticum]|uniref:Com family DNA-binding transcriptional regulator n=1 Tax=Chromobacterium haemolyticum TaxID=394935 RepID=UPI000D300511|nr:Com family DNA-binding transcriptional regulator [Chromobacterium haemolyticum]PTU71495.1 Com family DNA-binding transcriptional regulator [Chromobacterium haemolyticum]QOD81442.1 Com family DNA-binding transcriptional regulator [Chromobacterium haemolyticum]
MFNPEIRCGQCGRKLASGRYIELTIKCPRCRTMNHLKAESLTSERQGAPQPGESDGRQSYHPLAGRQASPG